MAGVSGDDVGLYWSVGVCRRGVPGIYVVGQVGQLDWVPDWLKQWAVGFSGKVELSWASTGVGDVSGDAFARL